MIRISLWAKPSYSCLGIVSQRIYLSKLPTHLNQDNQNLADLSLLRYPIVQTNKNWYGNIKPVFHRLRLSASAQGPTNPEQICFTQEPLGFRRHRISLCLSLLMPAYSLLSPPAVLTNQPSTVNRTLAYHLLLNPNLRYYTLQSRILSAPNPLTSELLRFL